MAIIPHLDKEITDLFGQLLDAFHRYRSQMKNMGVELQSRDDEIRHLKDRLFDLECSVHPDSNNGEAVCNYSLLEEVDDA